MRRHPCGSQDLIDRLTANGASGSLVEATITPLRGIYKRELSRPETGITINPTIALELPAARGKRDRVAPPAECAGLLSALSASERPLWATALYAVLRRGELMEFVPVSCQSCQFPWVSTGSHGLGSRTSKPKTAPLWPLRYMLRACPSLRRPC